jgi:hypothetical protein
MMMHKRKRTNKSKKGIFWAVTQGLLVAAFQWAAALAGHRRLRCRARGLLPAPFRAAGSSFLQGTFTSSVGTSEGRHGRIML